MSICRIGYRNREFQIQATSRKAAEAKALALAPGEIFSEHESEYQVSGCSRTLQK